MKDSDYALRWAKKIRAVRLLGGKCSRCGIEDLFVMEFHHDRGEKESMVSALLIAGVRWEDLRKEVEKCVLMCANCHQEHHHGSPSRGGEIKRNVLACLGKTKCDRCGYHGGSLASLDFHHRGDKSYNIGSVFSRKKRVTVESFFEELMKCDVVCKNCHRRDSFNMARFDRLKPLIYLKEASHRGSLKIDREEVLRLKKDDGLGVTAIAKRLGYHKSTVSMILSRAEQIE